MHIYTLIAAANIHIPRTMLDTEQINSTRYDSITNTRLHNYLIGDVIGKICKAKHLSLFATPLSFTAIPSPSCSFTGNQQRYTVYPAIQRYLVTQYECISRGLRVRTVYFSRPNDTVQITNAPPYHQRSSCYKVSTVIGPPRAKRVCNHTNVLLFDKRRAKGRRNGMLRESGNVTCQRFAIVRVDALSRNSGHVPRNLAPCNLLDSANYTAKNFRQRDASTS